MAEYALEIDGREYQPIPESWLEHSRAVDHDPEAPPNAVRLFATSVAAINGGQRLSIRYLDPCGDNVLERSTAAHVSDGSALPAAFAESADTLWARSYVPHEREEPDGTHRAVEWEHFTDLWNGREVVERAVGRRLAQ